MEAVDEFLEDYSQVYAQSTCGERRKQYVRLNKVINGLYSNKMISSDDPKQWTPEDAKVISAKIRSKKTYSSNYAGRLQGSMNVMCKYHLNRCFEDAKCRYPLLFPKKKEVRVPVLSKDEFEIIMRYCLREGQNFNELKMSAAVTLAICAGLRPQEVQYIRAENIDLFSLVINLQHVKGQDSYGIQRRVPMHPLSEIIISRYISEFRSRGFSGYLFQYKGEPISDNTLRSYIYDIGHGCGIVFSITKCRATWGQLLIDMGIRDEVVSVLMGHSSTAVTNKYYARTRENMAIDTVRTAWDTPQLLSPRDNSQTVYENDANGEQEGGQSSEEPDSEKEPPESYQKLTSIVDHIESSNLSSMNNNFKNSKLLKTFSIVVLCKLRSSAALAMRRFDSFADAKNKMRTPRTTHHTFRVMCPMNQS